MSKYPVIEEPGGGKFCEDQYPIMRGFRLACCDCNLVHDIEFDVFEVEKFFKDGTFDGNVRKGKKWRVAFRLKRNNRATAQLRRKK